MTKKASISVAFDGPPDRLPEAGQNLSGKILLDVHSRFITAKALKVSFVGEERTWINYDPVSNWNPRYSTGVRSIIEAGVPVDNNKLFQNTSTNRIPQGRHEVPFRFQMPSSLPGSRSRELKTGKWYEQVSHGCKVEYKLNIVLDVCGMQSNILHSEPINIRPKPRGVEPASAPHDTGIKTSLIQHRGVLKRVRGTLHHRVTVAKTVLIPGEECKLKIWCCNDSAVPVRSIHAWLQENVMIITGNRSQNFPTSLAIGSIPEDLVGRFLQPTKKSRPNPVPSEGPSFELTLAVPLNVSASYTGNISTIFHEMVVEIGMKEANIGSLTIKVPISIGEKPEESHPKPATAQTSAEHQGGNTLVSTEARSSVVVVPPGVYPGMQFRASIGGNQNILITCPPNAGPGTQVRVSLSSQPVPIAADPPIAAVSPTTSSPGFTFVEIPPGVYPGMEFIALIDGEQKLRVTCPLGSGPGKRVRVIVPTAPPAPDDISSAESEEVPPVEEEAKPFPPSNEIPLVEAIPLFDTHETTTGSNTMPAIPMVQATPWVKM